jgi:glutathione S-transferase
MITLYGFGRQFDLPDASPFVTKAEMLLKLAHLEYTIDTNGFSKAPKGKLPYLDDDGLRIADSTFIRFHIEKKYKIDFDEGLTPEQRAIAWAFEKMCEDHLYWAIMHFRWMPDDNFKRGPQSFFKSVPKIVRPLITGMVRKKVRSGIHSHGLGRHTDNEKNTLVAQDLKALSTYLADKPYFMGARPTGVDATIFSFVGGCLCPIFEGELRRSAEQLPNLVRYCERLRSEFYSELDPSKSASSRDAGVSAQTL